ncbi:sialidase domain-containing protein [[Ruminococcus] torques]|jgi:Neuraminidase (sialidase)/lysophospholipase L1-like esterase|uniref:sialidase domain-containing protein n=1 Tax=[Ruminococcus] torques TaxID=33039 RepID=UPI00307A1DB4
MRDWKRWTAVLLAGSLAFTAADDMKLIVQAYEMQNEQGQESYQAESKSKLDDLKEKAVLFQEFQGEEQRFDGTRAVDVSDHAEQIHKIETGSVVFRFKASKKADGVLLGAKDKTIDLPTDLNRGSDCTSFFIRANEKFRMVYKHTAAEHVGPASFSDGNWHTVVVSSQNEKSMRLTIDGQEMWSNTDAGNRGLFSKQSVLDQVTIGAQKTKDGQVYKGFQGEISHVIITSETLTDADAIAISKPETSGEIASGSAVGEMFQSQYGDNSWVFTGGEAVQGGFAQTRGVRNYVGQFEEYVRWTKAGNENGRQRYTINTGKAGQTLKDVVDNYQTLVADYSPKAAAYLVGKEDYQAGEAGIASFQDSLRQFINLSLGLKENGKGFAVIQKPFAVKDDAVNATIMLYCKAVDEVVKEYEDESEKLDRIVVVDHFAQTNQDDFKNNKLKDGQTLNAAGHFEIGKQFSAATIKTTDSYPGNGVTLNLKEEEQPDVYLNVLPVVTAENAGLHVQIPETNETSWRYELSIGDKKITGSADGNTFTITGAESGKEYLFKCISSDGTTQLQTVTGKTEAGNVGIAYGQTLDEKQKALSEKLKEKDKMTWLFMGDSITHAALWTKGYDGIAQTFEKYLKDEMGRASDTVINTAVSGATTTSTLNNIEQRLEKYTPDVVSIMLGTNDAATGGLTADIYKKNLETIIEKIRNKNKDAVIILRTPTPMWNTGSREANIPQYIAKMKQVADEQNLIYIDQYTELQKAFNDYGWLKKDTVLFGNNLHPGANGHLLMTRHFLKGCGLWKEDSAIANLFYEMPINEKTSEITPEVIKTPNRIGVSLEKLKEDSKSQIGAVHLKAVSKASGQTYETDAEAGEKLIVLKNLPENQKYEVEVSAWLKDRAEKTVFQKQEIELNNTLEEAFDICLSDEKVENLNEGTTVGTFTVNEMAPEGNYVFSLCTGEGDTHNPYFAIENGVLKTAKKLEEGKTYTIRLKAKNAEAEKEKIFKIYAVGRGLVFRKEDQKIAVGSPVELSTKDYAEKLMKLEEGTILVHYTSTSDQAIQSLFSVSNAKAGHENRHFHVYIRPEGVLGCEIRNESAMNYGFKAANAVKADYKGKPAENIIALQADKEKGTYQLFANGEKVLTVDAAALGGYRFISEITGLDTVSLGATKRGGINKYTFGGNIHKIEVYETPLTDEELIEETKKTAYPELQQIFHKNDGTGANYYRIPALLTLKSGTVISAADARFGGTHDSPNNIDIAVARSEDGGKNWSKPELPFHYEDYEDNTLEIPVGTQTRVNQSASFIDPVLLQDEETERVFLISDAMAAGYGSPQAVTGSGYKEIQGKKYLKLQKAGETDYNYTVRENGVIYNDTTNQPTEYSLNSNFEILKDNVLQTVKQKSSRFDPTNGSGQLVTDETDKDVPMNIMYADAVFKALPTTWLYMKYSDDDGKTWSDPILLNGMVKAEDSRVLVTGPGRGMQIKNGEYKGRLIVPVYDTAQSGIIYSDDHGATWNYAKGPSTKKAAMSESQIVEMPDGTLRVYARSTGSKIAEAVSLDGGKTWTEAAYVPGMTQPGWGSQLSVIRYGGLIEGKPALIMSTPAGVGNYRRDGRVKIGLITDTGKEGSEKYKIDWTYDYSVDSKNAGFAYSCLSELPNHQIGLMYEKYDSYNPAELHSQDIMKYEELSLSELMGKEVVEIIPQTEGKGTVSQRNTVKKGSKITIEAYPEEGYQFVRWEDEKGNPVSEQEKYTFDAKESAAFTAVFEQEKEEVDKSHLKEAIRHAEEQMQDEKYQDVIPVVREEYEEAYKNAKAIDEKPDATSEEVETAYKTLIEVGKRLTMYKGDLTELQAAYDLYAGKDLSIYTQDSKTVLEEALKEAEKVLKLGENAVKEDVNEALEKLQKAIEGLEKSEPNPPTDPEFPTDPDSGNTDIVNPDNSLSPDDTPSTNGTPSASDEKAVATGDKETPVGWTTLGFAAMLAAAGRFLGRKKRR